jgi:hypothetical protein
MACLLLASQALCTKNQIPLHACNVQHRAKIPAGVPAGLHFLLRRMEVVNN